ncbi:MAG: hypothetical protein AAFQ94_12705, partial [Bacteroidota bacterium]
MTKSIIAILIGLLSFAEINGQELQGKDSIITSAMRDELKRNMENLSEEGYDKPFFMGYRVSDLELKLASATLGALTMSREGKTRDWNTRIMVGDYDINDENFNDSFEGNSKDTYYESVPLEEDYWGIRRMLWASTNNVYKRAARLYKQKVKAINDFDIDYKLSDFSKEEPQKYRDDQKLVLADRSALENLSIELSSHLREYDSIDSGSATVTEIGGRNYYENSEGTSIIKNEQMSLAVVRVSRLNKASQLQSANLNYFAPTLSELPETNVIKADIAQYIDHLQNRSSLEELEDDYSGPVLLKGQAVAEFLKTHLFNASKGIFAMRKPFSNKNEEVVNRHFDELNDDLTKDDKLKIGNKKMIVTSYSGLKEFRGQKLIGSYAIDSEGVVPPDSLVLIKDGLIQQKINGRMPAPQAKKSTGGKRFSISVGGQSNRMAPGVLKVDFTESITEAEIYELFKKKIAENDEEVGIVLEKPELVSSTKPRQYFTYNRISGEREQIGKASFSNSAK